MKPTEKDLKAMFGQTPDSFTLAMERALAGETPDRETPAPRRLNRMWSIVLIVALALVLTVGAYAAAVRLGLIDFIGRGYLGYVPPSALDILESTEVQSYEVGPLTISLNETYADGYTVYTIWQARMTDGSDALFSQWYDSFYQDTPEVLQKRLGLQDGFFGAAAAAYEGPIYSAQVWVEIDPEMIRGEQGIMDGVYGEDGSMAWAYMLDTDPKAIGDTVVCHVDFRVCRLQIDSFTDGALDSRELERWDLAVDIEVPVTGVTESRTYLPVAENDLGYGIVERMDVEHAPAGLYCFVTYRVTDEDADPYSAYNMMFLDENMAYYPTGMYMSGSIDTGNFPEVVAMHFLSADEMPECIYLRQGDRTIEFR